MRNMAPRQLFKFACSCSVSSTERLLAIHYSSHLPALVLLLLMYVLSPQHGHTWAGKLHIARALIRETVYVRMHVCMYVSIYTACQLPTPAMTVRTHPKLEALSRIRIRTEALTPKQANGEWTTAPYDLLTFYG